MRIGMLGSGFVANFYMEGLKDVPGQEVVLVVGRTEENVRAFAEKWRIPQFSTDLAGAVSRDDVDLFLIALPNYLHRDVAVDLAKAGRAQVCTKPLARTAQEAKEMRDAVRSAGVFNGYAETEVFAPAVVRAESLIRKGLIGRVLWVRSREAHFGPHSPWFWDPDLSGGGALLDMGCHCIEAARYFFGKDVRPIEVIAWADTLHHSTKAEDNALAIIRFENGGIAHLEVSWTSRGGLDLRNEIYGTEGAIFTDVTRGTPIEVFSLAPAGYIVEKADIDVGWTKPVPEEAFTYGYQAEMKHFVDCLRDGLTPRETYEDGYIVNCILDAAYRSIRSRQWEKIEYEP
ncbi:MAG: Gfo/Idh/MocA family oxidoreductase [Armatimonadetes bacterium]|nr:Gfo/Idh/MocA family oxidoreductase [Armatimonadota bacterium]